MAIRVNGERYGPYGYLLIPYCRNGTLIDLIMKAIKIEHQLSPELLGYLARQAVEGLMELHINQGLAHRDIKPDNIVIKDDLSLAYIDFA